MTPTDTLSYPVAPLAPWQARRRDTIQAKRQVTQDDATVTRQRLERTTRETFAALFAECGVPWFMHRQPPIALRMAPCEPTHFGVEIDAMHFTLWQLEPGASEFWLRFSVADGSHFLSAIVQTQADFDEQFLAWLQERARLGLGADDGH